MGTGGADHRTDDGDGARALERDGHQRARRDEVDQTAEERLVAVNGVVTLGEIAIHLHQLESHDLQAAFLETRNQASGEQPLDGIGLDQDEGAFGHDYSGLSDGWFGGSPPSSGGPSSGR